MPADSSRNRQSKRPANPEQVVAAERRKLRQELRQARAQLGPEEQLRAASKLYQQLIHTPAFHQARRIAFYLPADGELDPRPLLHSALQAGKHCYLPSLSPLRKGKMYFVRVRSGQTLKSNRWGIPEPEPRLSDIIRPWALDIVFVPLVGFDARGNRLGMGKGYYDRAFAFRQHFNGNRAARRHRPLLLGLAHSCQERPEIPVCSHDVSMDRVISPLSL